jgi:prephenate dehydrogenase
MRVGILGSGLIGGKLGMILEAKKATTTTIISPSTSHSTRRAPLKRRKSPFLWSCS